MQGVIFRKGNRRFEGQSVENAIDAALADANCHMVNRNQGAGTRILIDRLLGAARPSGYRNQPKSHNAAAAALAQGRADWGVAIEPVARAHILGFLPLSEERYDFAIPNARLGTKAVQIFVEALATGEIRGRLRQAGFVPAISGDATECE